jgi:ATP diphosphatase
MVFQHSTIHTLLDVMAQLRDPNHGCPWDLEQDFASIVPHTIEEVFEVADAIDREAWDELRDELGDLLFQVVFYARIAEEQRLFDFAAVAGAVSRKLIRRHPHVFANERIDSAAEQTLAWERHKEAERAERADAEGCTPGALDGVGRGLPSMVRALRLQERAARVGFDWDAPQPVLEKVCEEVEEVREALDGGQGSARLEHEIGDLLFATVNLSRHLDVDPENALRRAGRRFEGRFRFVESALRERGLAPQEATLEDMDVLWEAAKRNAAQDAAAGEGR